MVAGLDAVAAALKPERECWHCAGRGTTREQYECRKNHDDGEGAQPHEHIAIVRCFACGGTGAESIVEVDGQPEVEGDSAVF